MRDFLDNLIDRHTDRVPQIKPRLPSMFEPEVSHGGLDVAIEEKESTTLEETETLRQPPHAAQSAGPPTVAEPVRPIASPAPTVPAREEKLSVKVGPNESVFSLSPLETPILLSPSQGGGEEGVKGANSASDPLTLTLSQKERGLNEGFPKSSAATLIAPVASRVRHTHQEARTELTPPSLQAAAENQISVKEGVNKPVFPLPTRETPTLPSPSQGGGRVGVRGLNQGLLEPSATLIAPVIPSVAEPERAVSQPEPVINVTIGRIEVRASMPPQKQAPKPEIRSPVMGLEEYLRRRSGGQDR